MLPVHHKYNQNARTGMVCFLLPLRSPSNSVRLHLARKPRSSFSPGYPCSSLPTLLPCRQGPSPTSPLLSGSLQKLWAWGDLCVVEASGSQVLSCRRKEDGLNEDITRTCTEGSQANTKSPIEISNQEFEEMPTCVFI